MFERRPSIPPEPLRHRLATKGHASRYAPIIVLAVSAAPLAHAAEPDLRCTHADAAVTEQLRAMLDDPDLRATVTIYHSMSKMTMARIDCRRGRVDRGLETYRQLETLLSAQGSEQVATK